MADPDILAHYYGDGPSTSDVNAMLGNSQPQEPVSQPQNPSLFELGKRFLDKNASQAVTMWRNAEDQFGAMQQAENARNARDMASLGSYFGAKLDPEALGTALPLLIGGVKGSGPSAIPRELDPLGFYSQALEAAKAWPQAKGTPQQALQALKSAGTKDAEIAATGLPAFLQDKASVSREDLVNHLRQNRVQLNEGVYGKPPMDAVLSKVEDLTGNQYDENNLPNGLRVTAQQAIYGDHGVKGAPKWAEYSLDPSNPTYRESVLHLPSAKNPIDKRMDEILAQLPSPNAIRGAMGRGLQGRDEAQAAWAERPDLLAEHNRLQQERNAIQANEFRSGHFDEPNIIAHLRTSIQKDAQGNPVLNLDELQSDWGQKLREGGVRDEAKIAELGKRRDDLYGQLNAEMRNAGIKPSEISAMTKWVESGADDGKGMPASVRNVISNIKLTEVELNTAKAATPGHPLVNTTDQWTTTALRRLLQQATQNPEVKGIAITPGQIQNERFSLSRVIPEIQVNPGLGGGRQLHLFDENGNTRGGITVSPDGRILSSDIEGLSGRPLAEAVGKELANEIMATNERTTLDTSGLEFGGQGMRYAYDQMYTQRCWRSS